MKTKFTHSLIIGLVALASICDAQDYPKTRADAEKLANDLKYQHGEINLPGGLAKLKIPNEFKYLNPADTAIVLEKLWRNPPSEERLGMLLPADKTPLDEDCWAVTISYVDDGYVKDDDAGKINYADLLKQMQRAVKENNKERVKQGYPAIELIGWAAPPHYDAVTHKLYWAKNVKFEGETGNTLNYDIRILGRRGVLVLSAIATMNQLGEIEKQTPQILSMVNFNDGNRYADFDSKTDKVATYGIAALVAGGIAAKLGFFKLIWVFLLAAKKFVIIAVIAVGAWIKKLVSRSKSSTPT